MKLSIISGIFTFTVIKLNYFKLVDAFQAVLHKSEISLLNIGISVYEL